MTKINSSNDNGNSAWETIIPWFLTIGSSITLISIAFFLIQNIEWFKTNVFNHVSPDNAEFRIYAFQMHLAMIKSSIGLFSGFALIFLGTGVIFFSVKKISNLNVEAENVKFTLATAYPGLIALLLGVIMVLFTIGSKNEFPNYQEDNPHLEIPLNRI
jgi:hypothetical protein